MPEIGSLSLRRDMEIYQANVGCSPTLKNVSYPPELLAMTIPRDPPEASPLQSLGELIYIIVLVEVVQLIWWDH